MSNLGFDGMIKVSFVPTIADPDAPTVAELTAGVPLEGRLTPDGVEITPDTSSVDTSKLNSTANSSRIGRDSYTISVTYVIGDESDDEAQAVQDALVRGAAGFLTVRRDKSAQLPWAAADKAELYPVQCHTPAPAKVAPNADQTVTVGMEMTDGNKVRGYGSAVTVAAGA